MEQKDSVTEMFERLEDGDEVLVETEYDLKYNRVVHNDSPLAEEDREQQFVFGEYEALEYLVHTHRGVQVKDVESDGSLEVNGEKVTTFVNITSDEWAGENRDLLIN